MREMIRFSSSSRSRGITVVIDRPTISRLLYPNSRRAAGFHDRTVPRKSLVMIASSEYRTIPNSAEASNTAEVSPFLDVKRFSCTRPTSVVPFPPPAVAPPLPLFRTRLRCRNPPDSFVLPLGENLSSNGMDIRSSSDARATARDFAYDFPLQAKNFTAACKDRSRYRVRLRGSHEDSAWRSWD